MMTTDLHVPQFLAPPAPSATPASAQAVVTIKHMVDLLLARHIPKLKNPRSMLCRVHRYFPPLHDRTLDTLSVLEVEAWRDTIKSRSQAANCLSDLRLIYNKAVYWGLYRGANIAAYVKNERSPKRTTYVEEHEMPRVLATILSQPFPDRIFFYTLPVLACRPIELERMQVADVRVWMEGETWAGIWKRPAGTTKTGKAHPIPLPPILAEMFAQYIPTLCRDAKWMFPGRDESNPRSKESWFYRWAKIRRQAGIPHVWCYDLRRTGSTWAYDSSKDFAGVSKGMLGHTSYKATDHYLQLMHGSTKTMLGTHEDRLLATCTGR